MARIFVYDDREFPDPDPQMSVEQVKSTLADFYGEIRSSVPQQGEELLGLHAFTIRMTLPSDS